jgi:protein O-mannosyl-transferase
MQLTHKQQRYIRKNHARKSVHEIARKLNVADHDISSYLARITGSGSGAVQQGAGDGETTWLDRISPYWFLLVFAVLAALIYGVTLPYAFISDDFSYIVDNPRLRDIGYVFQVPLTSAKALLDVAIYNTAGADPVFFRLKNVLFHLGSAWMLFLILRQWRRTLAAAIAGILFVVHPIVTESVTWIGGGGYPQYAFFFLASFYFYTGKGSVFRSVVLPAILFLLMLLSSEKSVSLALAYPLYELSKGTAGRNWKRTLPYLFMSTVWVLLILFVFRYTQTRIQTLETSFYHGAGGYYNPLIQIPTAVTTYLSLIFWPAMLSFYQSELTTGTLGYAFRVAGFLVYAAATVAAYRANKSVFFFLMLFIVSLLPMLTPLKIGWVVAERYVYLGSAAVIAAFSVAVSGAAGKRRSQTLFGIVFSIITLALLHGQ